MRKVELYQCEKCLELYDTPSEAVECEHRHGAMEDLKIIEIDRFLKHDREARFPRGLIVEDEKWSGVLAQYSLFKVAVVEEFYEEDDFYFEINKRKKDE